MMRSLLFLATLVALGSTFSSLAAPPPDQANPLDALARQYVLIVLGVGRHDPNFVDAYYGPPEWQKEADQRALDLPALHRAALETRKAVQAVPVIREQLSSLRHTYLDRQLAAVAARIEQLLPNAPKRTFDEESRALYDAISPVRGPQDFDAELAKLERLLPGSGPLPARYETFRQQFVVPPQKLPAVFREAVDECRRRTLRHVALPKDESFTIEYVKDKPWSGYNWYKGNSHSVIQVNTDLPTTIDRALDLACHEGYPGHHVYNALLEQALVKGRGYQEFTVYPLFSPQSLIAEGTANYGIEVTFPGNERAAYERAKLFPLAGLDPSQAERFYEVQELVERLGYAGTEAARGLLEGRLTKTEAAQFLERYLLYSPQRAEQRVRFFETYRSYTINYTLGKDLVKAYVEKRAGHDPARRWAEFTALLASPRLPGGLQ